MTGMVSASTLERAPQRALNFLLGLADPTIWQKLQQNGMNQADIKLGAERLRFLLPGVLPNSDNTVPEATVAKRAAIAELTVADEYLLVKYRPLAMMIDREAGAWLFEGLTASPTDDGSIRVVQTLLTRASALEQGEVKEYKSSELLPRLAERGFTSEYRAKLADLVELALAVTPGAPADELSTPTGEARTQALEELHYWWHAAAGMARTAGLKRGQLIRLGLAKRRTTKEVDDGGTLDDADDLDPVATTVG